MDISQGPKIHLKYFQFTFCVQGRGSASSLDLILKKWAAPFHLINLLK